MRDPDAIMSWRLVGGPAGLGGVLGTLTHASTGSTTARGAAARWIWDTGTAAGLSSSLARAVREAEAAIANGPRVSGRPSRAGAGPGSSLEGVTRSVITSVGGMRSAGAR